MRRKLRTHLVRYRIPPEDAEDVLQQAMVALVYSWEEIENPEAWLSGTIRNKCLLYWRERRRRLYQAVDTVFLEWVAGESSSGTERVELTHDLNSLIARLPKRCRRVLQLRYGLGLEPAEVAEKLGYKSSSISKVTTRCLAALNREMILAGFSRRSEVNEDETGETEQGSVPEDSESS